MPTSSDFDDSIAPYKLRPELAAAHRRAFERVAKTGTWLRGHERVEVAAEVRQASTCSLCAERKTALSPNAVKGDHDTCTSLSAAMVDAIHRITTDPGRLSRPWFDSLIEQGLSAFVYVEILGIVTQILSIDTFHRGMGLELEPLPGADLTTEPGKVIPNGLADDGAWVKTISESHLSGDEIGLYGHGPRSGNVIRAMSSVPAEVRALRDLSSAQYLDDLSVADASASGKGDLSRVQMELLAARVSTLNECFYWSSSHAMLLRASGQAQSGSDIDVAVVAATPDAAAGSKIEHASELLAFADAAIGGSGEDIAKRRSALSNKIGDTAVVDAAAVIGNFQRMNRIADATGLPLDTPVRLLAADIGRRIGADRFESAGNSPPVGALARLLGPLLRPTALRLAGLISRSVKKRIS